MPCTIADCGLLPSAELEELLATFHPLDYGTVSKLDHCHGELESIPLPIQPDDQPLRINRLFWPSGASRSATFHTVVDDSRLVTIRSAVGSTGAAVELEMDDGTRNITTDIYLTDVRPLFQITDKPQLYLLSFADQRYRWRWRTGSISSQPSSWSGLFASLASALGITLTVAAVDSAYGVPSSRWIQYRKPLATLLDAAAAAVGQRVVVGLDGAVRTTSWETATTATTTQYGSVRKMIGGTVAATDTGRVVPASTITLFGKTTSGVPQSDPYTVTNSLAALAPTVYDDTWGATGETATLLSDLVYTGSNSSACATLAAALATDYYGWQAANLDVTLPGIWDWSPTGAEDFAEWVYRPGNVTTAIRKGPRQVVPVVDYTPPAADPRTVYYAEQTACEDGLLAVYTAPVQQAGTGQITIGDYEFDRYEGCCSCEGLGSGGTSGSGVSGSGVSGGVAGWGCDAYTAFGTTLLRRSGDDRSSVWTGGDYTLSGTRSGDGTYGWKLEQGVGAGGCEWFGPTTWDGTGCITFHVAARHPAGCDATVSVCCSADSGGGGGAGTVTTTCCPTRLLPATLYVTLTNTSGCSALAGTYAVVWDGVNSRWGYSTTIGGKAFELRLTCLNPDFSLYVKCGMNEPTFNATPTSCSPFLLATTGYTYTDCCTGSLEAVVTETP